MDEITTSQIIPDLPNQFSALLPPNVRSKVINYVGLAGLKEVTANSLRAKGELLILEIESMSKFLDFGFSEQVRQQFVAKQIQVREITNEPTLKAWTEIQEFVDNFWNCRQIDPAKLKTDVEILIYNDVVAMYNYTDNNIYAIEIYNQQFAQMQRQMFEFVWQSAVPMIKGKGGVSTISHAT